MADNQGNYVIGSIKYVRFSLEFHFSQVGGRKKISVRNIKWNKIAYLSEKRACST
jgi:hypothetical protein